MADHRKTQSFKAPGASAGASIKLPAYGAPQTDPAPAIREPGRPRSTRRAPDEDGAAIRLPGRGERLDPDDRLARPEFGDFGEEVIDGVRIECSPSKAGHADPQCRLAAVVSICLAKGYIASTELLTRTDEESDFATDVCVRKVGKDPESGWRHLEELSFEVAHSQTLENLKQVRVPKLVRAGVRRIFAILVQEGDVLEWSADAGEWIGLTPGDTIRDQVFVQPLEIEAILDAAKVDQLVSKAQLAKREPYLMSVIKKARAKGVAEGEAKGEAKGRAEGEAKGRAEGEAKGEAKGLAEAILRVFHGHGIELDDENRQALLACRDTELLGRWLDKALVAQSASDVLAELEEMS